MGGLFVECFVSVFVGIVDSGGVCLWVWVWCFCSLWWFDILLWICCYGFVCGTSMRRTSGALVGSFGYGGFLGGVCLHVFCLLGTLLHRYIDGAWFSLVGVATRGFL